MRSVAEFVNDKRLSHVPAPNVYSSPCKDKTQAPSWPTSKENRFKGSAKKQPGPGEYEHQVFTDNGPKYTQRPKPFINPMKNKTAPGPGFYNPDKYKNSNFQFSMRKKANGGHDLGTPGPGAYGDERELHYKSIPGSKIGSDKRKSDHFLHTSSYKKQEPGRYSLHDFAGNDLMGVPKFSFSKDTKMKTIKSQQPGPGNYNIKSRMTDGVP